MPGSIGAASPSRFLEIGAVGEELYVIERRIHGVALADKLGDLAGPRRELALHSHLAAARAICRLAPPQAEFGELLTDGQPLTRATWRDYLRDSAAQAVARLRPTLIIDVPGIDRALPGFAAMVEDLPEPEPRLVHGDYHPGNTLVDADGRLVGVIDFGPLTLSGDPLLDVVCAISFLGYARDCRPADKALLRQLAGDDPGLAAGLAVYDAYYAFRFADMKLDGPEVYAWSVATLRALGEGSR